MLERCLWIDSAPPLSLPAASLPANTDVAIIGGGYTGLSAARCLARRGTDVTVLERHTLGWGASGRNGGFVLPGFKPEMEELDRRLGSHRASAMFQLSLAAVAFLEELVQQEGIDCDFARSGALTLAAKPAHLRALAESGRFLRERLNYETELLAASDLSREIGSQRYHGGLLDPRGCSVQPAKYVAGLAMAAARAGARLIQETEVLQLRRVQGGFELRTRGGTVKAREVLAATNGYT